LDILIERSGKSTLDAKESSIPSDVRGIFMACGELRWDAKVPSLQQSSINGVADRIVTMVNAYALAVSVLIKLRHADEVKYVQPLFHKEVGVKLGSFMRNSKNVTLQNEARHKYFEEKDGEPIRLDITGITDHVLQITNTAFCALTMEDKKLSKLLVPIKFSRTPSESVSQAVSQMKYEVLQLISTIEFDPPEYCGILQNGPNWVFVFRIISRLGRVMWQYVACPPIVCNKGIINEKNCGTVARFLEHTIVIADCITDAVLGGAITPSAAPVGDASDVDADHPDEENEEDDNEEREEESYQYNVKGGGKRAGDSKRGAGSGMRHTKLSDNPEWGVDKENKEFPLSVANLHRIGLLG
jgi:hypothetical protein